MARTLPEVLAADGKPYDIDYVKELRRGEVEVIQYLRPDGKRRRMATFLGEDYAKKAEDLILSMEELTTGEVTLYGRKKSWPLERELTEVAQNGPGPESPNNKLCLLIDKVCEEN